MHEGGAEGVRPAEGSRAVVSAGTASLEALHERILACVPVGLVVLDDTLRVVSANPAFSESVGVDALSGRLLSAVLPSRVLEEHTRAVLTTGEPRRGIDHELPKWAGGPNRSVRISLLPLPRLASGGLGVLLVMEDKSESQDLLAKAMESERRLQELVEHAADAVVLVDQSGRLTYLNLAAERMFAYRRDELMGVDARVILPEGFFTPGDRHSARRVAKGETVGRMPVRSMQACRKDGSAVSVEGSLAAWSIGDATEDGVIYAGVLRDVSSRRKAEEALRRSEASFRALIENSPDGVGIHRDGRFIYANSALVGMLRYQRGEDLAGRSVLEMVHAEDREAFGERVRLLVMTGGAAPPRECRLLRSDHSPLWVEVVALSVVYDGAPAVVFIARDTNERRLMQARVAQADRMMSVGTLAAGVAHEINNPLTFVISNLGFVSRELTEIHDALKRSGGPSRDETLSERLSEVRQAVTEARDGSDRVRVIVRDLKTFSRSDEERRGRIDVRASMDTAVTMAQNEIRFSARLLKDYADVPPVEANDARLGQVFINLLVNAAQSIGTGDVGGNLITARTLTREDGKVVVEVKDTGVGIAREHIPRVFDPFFTTKPVGEGTGLGLSVCMGIVSQMGGEMEVESEVGVGTTFRVVLPAAPPELGVTGVSIVPERGVRRGRILVVDDEPGIGKAVQWALKREHDVQVSLSARDALKRLMAGEEFELILCDLMMPEMTGMDLHAHIERMLPGVTGRLVFLTGGAFTPRARAFLDQVPNARLDKPFQEDELQLFVRDRLA